MLLLLLLLLLRYDKYTQEEHKSYVVVSGNDGFASNDYLALVVLRHSLAIGWLPLLNGRRHCQGVNVIISTPSTILG